MHTREHFSHCAAVVLVSNTGCCITHHHHCFRSNALQAHCPFPRCSCPNTGHTIFKHAQLQYPKDRYLHEGRRSPLAGFENLAKARAILLQISGVASSLVVRSISLCIIHAHATQDVLQRNELASCHSFGKNCSKFYLPNHRRYNMHWTCRLPRA